MPHAPGVYDVENGRHVNFLDAHSRYSLPRGPGEPGELYERERLVAAAPGVALLIRVIAETAIYYPPSPPAQ